MIRSEERRARRQQAMLRQELDEYERAIAGHAPEPPPGILPWAHRAYLAGLHGVRDDLRAQLGMSLTGDAGGRS